MAALAIGVLPADAQKQFRGDLALSWLSGPVKRVENQTAKLVLEFDRDGNMTQRIVNGKPMLIEVQSRDAYGRPLRMVERSVATAPGLLFIFTYDDCGRLVTMVRKNNGTNKTLFTRRYFYDGNADYPTGYYEVCGSQSIPEVVTTNTPGFLTMDVLRRDSKGNPVMTNQNGFIDENYIIEYY